MDMKFRKLLLSELHMAVFRPGRSENLTDTALTKAVTLNENLRFYGFTLKPKDIVSLAASEGLDGFYEDFRALIPEVKAEPMYPDFPSQVMEMSEAQFRLHQAVHYFSTYGLELLTGCKVTRGWLPDVSGTPKTEQDEILLDAKVLDLVPEEEAYAAALRIILGKRERPTLPETELILESVRHVSQEELKTVKIPFKENLLFVFRLLVQKADRDSCVQTLSHLCAHTGDVLKCIHSYLKEKKYHLRTSEKRTFVRLLEQYPVKDFRENLMRSNCQREKNLVILRHLDFNRYSANPAHMEAVRALRNDELLSWEGQVEALLRAKDPAALSFIGKRPGMLLRKLNRLVEIGYSEEELTHAICVHAEKLSPHTLVQTIQSFSMSVAEIERKYQKDLENFSANLKLELQRAIYACRNRYQIRKCQYQTETLNRNKRDEISRARTELGIPAVLKEKQNLLKMLSRYQRMTEMIQELRNMREIRFTNSGCEIDWDMLTTWLLAKEPNDAAKLRLFVSELEEKLAVLEEELAVLKEKLEEKTQEIFSDASIQLERLEKEELDEITRINMENSDAYREGIEKIMQEHERSLNRLKNSDIIRRILSRALQEHFTLAATPLKGKKVFLDLDAFDLGNSELELKEKSAEGGYIRSGIAYKIPEDARYVRFFTYWNDIVRVDVDLHANGFATDGTALHIGWNGDFKQSGVIFSGDITHSNAAEYIDIDLLAPVRVIYANVVLFSGKPGFDKIKECFVGLMAVKNAHETVRHYNPANCFFTHTIRQHTRRLYYGYIDVQNRYVRFVGQKNNCGDYCGVPDIDTECRFSVEEYLNCLLNEQQVQLVEKKEDAEVILTMGKSEDARAISLADNNFFLEY